MLQSEVRSVVLRTELQAKRILANGLLSFRPEFFLNTVSDAESADDEVDFIICCVLDNFKTTFQLVFIAKLRTRAASIFPRYAGGAMVRSSNCNAWKASRSTIPPPKNSIRQRWTLGV